MRKSLNILLLCASLIIAPPVLAATSASQTVSATLTRTTPGPDPGPGGGGAVAIGVGGGAAAAAAGAYAFAPLLLAGLSPNSMVFAAAPIGCLPCATSHLQCALLNHFGVTDYNAALAQMNCDKCRYFLAQNNSELINGTFDLNNLVIPEELRDAQKLKINITLASQPYKEVYGDPELTLGVYENISKANLSKKFETQQFLHNYLMNKYQTTMKTTYKGYNVGLQKLSGLINMNNLNNKAAPLQIAIRYTEGGFKKGQKVANPKTLVYAYVVELERIR